MVTNDVADDPNAPTDGWMEEWDGNRIEGAEGRERGESKTAAKIVLKRQQGATTIASVSGMGRRGRIVFDELARRKEARGMPLVVRIGRSPRRWPRGGAREVWGLNGESRWWGAPRSSEINRCPGRNGSSAPYGAVNHRPT